jgi:hypothetical protein
MKSMTIAVTLSAVLILLAGCGPRPGTEAATDDKNNLVVTGPDQYGVVCYRYHTSSNNLSCVKVQ